MQQIYYSKLSPEQCHQHLQHQLQLEGHVYEYKLSPVEVDPITFELQYRESRLAIWQGKAYPLIAVGLIEVFRDGSTITVSFRLRQAYRLRYTVFGGLALFISILTLRDQLLFPVYPSIFLLSLISVIFPLIVVLLLWLTTGRNPDPVILDFLEDTFFS